MIASVVSGFGLAGAAGGIVSCKKANAVDEQEWGLKKERRTKNEEPGPGLKASRYECSHSFHVLALSAPIYDEWRDLREQKGVRLSFSIPTFLDFSLNSPCLNTMDISTFEGLSKEELTQQLAIAQEEWKKLKPLRKTKSNSGRFSRC